MTPGRGGLLGGAHARFYLALLILIPISLYASARSNSGGLAERVAELEAQVEELSAILQFVRVETEEINNLAGPHWIIEGANVHVRSGSGGTSDGCGPRAPDFPNCESLTGLGNLLVGYNELLTPRPPPGGGDRRTGSHNLVIGRRHQYTSYGGFVAGDHNMLLGAAVSVSGGASNVAIGQFSSVSGGASNVASGLVASVSGGERHEAPDDYNWAAGDLFEAN